MKQLLYISAISLLLMSCSLFNPTPVEDTSLLPVITLKTKTAGNPAESQLIKVNEIHKLQGKNKDVKLELKNQITGAGKSVYTLTVKANKDVNFHVSLNFQLENMPHDTLDFLLPGLWYKRNLFVSDGAPSMKVSDEWMFREDRLSTPMVAAYNPVNQHYYALRHTNKIENDYLLPYNNGEVIMYGESDLGSVGFGKEDKNAYLAVSYPVAEYPKAYTRKLQLTNPITVFKHLKKGEEIVLTYEVVKGKASSYSAFVKEMWQYAYDSYQPEQLVPEHTPDEVKQHLADYYRQSYTDEYPLKGYSGVHVHIDQCEKRGIIEVGFIGRVLLNALYALQYGEQTGDAQLVKDAYAIYDSYLANGFTSNGFIREKIDFKRNHEWDELSIRRQSEGVMALLYFLDYEKSKGRNHPEWEKKIQTLLQRFIVLQREDNSFPRKFDNNMKVIDDTGGSSSCAVLPLTMAYKYFNEPKYLEVAEKTATYMKKESVDKGVYFSSTLDARCEDKEASIYITTAYYYLWLTTGKQEYVDYASQSVYFSLSYYYTWDVPFAKGQMLGDLGLKSRGWGNVSVENNHIDVYVFEFIDVLNWLSRKNGDKRLEAFGKVMASSMQDQLLPVEGRLCGVAKPGYYPEVVQHTNWDYGVNGKGYYNRLFGPGWVVASLWTMLSPGNTEAYFNKDVAIN